MLLPSFIACLRIHRLAAILHRTYYVAQFYWWDALELTRKLLLFVQTAVWNGGEPTVALAISVCAMALQLQVRIMAYDRPNVTFSSFFFFCCRRSHSRSNSTSTYRPWAFWALSCSTCGSLPALRTSATASLMPRLFSSSRTLFSARCAS